MKHPLVRLCFLIVIGLYIALVMSVSIAKSQPVTPCPPLTQFGTTQTASYVEDFVFRPYNVNYRHRVVSANRIDIAVDWTSLTGVGQPYSRETLIELLRVGILKNIVNNWGGENFTVPTCTTPGCSTTVDVVFYETTKCTHWSSCRFELVKQGQSECCNADYNGPNEIQDINGVKYITALRLKDCGTKCCTLTFKICKEPTSNSTGWNFKVCGKPVKSDSPGSSCSGPGNPENSCWTGQPQPCTGDCTK